MRRVSLACLVLTCLASSGCYYGHLATGQIRLLWQRQPLEEARVDSDHSEEVRALLGLVEEVRAFAGELGLAIRGQYTSYVDWPGDRIVTTVVRTRRGSLESVPWWYPVVGRLPYKGYFDRARAEAEAATLLESGGYDVCVSGVAAYSTLGWLDDPVTRPMLSRGSASLVETLFHELVHATAFLPGEADFNEGVAQFIGQRAAIAFFESHPTKTPPPSGKRWPTAEHMRARVADRTRIALSTLAYRDEVAALDGHPERASLRASLESSARTRIANLPLEVIDAEEVAEKARLSDACLALRGTYVADLPRHAAVLEALGGDLNAMIERLALWAEEDRASEDFFAVAATDAVRSAQGRAP